MRLMKLHSFVSIVCAIALTLFLVNCNNDDGVSTPQIRITSVTPDEIAAGKDEVELQILGSGFQGAIAISMGADINVLSFHVADTSRITVTVDVNKNATPGPRTIVVTTPTGSGQLNGGLEVKENRDPKVSFTVEPPSGNQGTTFTFDGRESEDPDGKIKVYHWDFGDGTEATKAVVKHKFAASGAKTVTLTVTDDAGFRNSRIKTVKVVFDAQIAIKEIDAVCKQFLRLYDQVETLSPDEILIGFSTEKGCPGYKKELGIIERNQAVGGTVNVSILGDTLVTSVNETIAESQLAAIFSGRHSDGSFFDGVVTHYFRMRSEPEGWKICDFRVD